MRSWQAGNVGLGLSDLPIASCVRVSGTIWLLNSKMLLVFLKINLIKRNRYDYEASHRACFLGWTSSLSYSIVLLVITFCFPLVSMLVFYYAILQVARTKCKRINFGNKRQNKRKTTYIFLGFFLLRRNLFD